MVPFMGWHKCNDLDKENDTSLLLLLLSRSQIQDYMPVAGTNKTLKQEVDESSAPNALFSGTLRKLTRPGRRMSRSLSANIDGSVTQGLTLALNGDGVVFDDGTESYPLYDEGMDLEGAVSDIAVAFTDINNADVNNVISTAPWGALATVLGGESLLLQSKAEIDLPNIQEEVNPMKRVQDELLQNIQVWNPDVNEGEGDYQNLVELGEIMAYPELDFPLYEYLEKFAKHAILPNLDSIPEDSVTLMQTNPKFIDSLMIGANQEMAKELLWRKYPTDQKGSYFRMFWNKGDSDVTSDQDYYDTDVHAGVDDTLNLHQLPDAWNSSDRLILVMRGELFDKFPGVQIFASKAIWVDDDNNSQTPDILTHSTDDADIILPEFKAKLGHDLYLVSFNMTVVQAQGQGDDPGYYFVFQERMGELRFGLDEYGDGAGAPPVEEWDEMHWHDSALSDFIDVSANLAVLFGDPGEVAQLQGEWGESSARMASIVNQKPIYFKVHAEEII